MQIIVEYNLSVKLKARLSLDTCLIEHVCFYVNNSLWKCVQAILLTRCVVHKVSENVSKLKKTPPLEC